MFRASLVLTAIDADGVVGRSVVPVVVLWPDMTGQVWEFCALIDAHLPGGEFVPAGRCGFAPATAFSGLERMPARSGDVSPSFPPGGPFSGAFWSPPGPPRG